MILYLAVTPDEYELPIYVAKTMTELAKVIGCDTSSVSRGIKDENYRIKLKLKFRKVEIGESIYD